MKKTTNLFFIVAICSLAAACSPTIEEEKPNYKQPQFGYEDLWDIPRFNIETAEILDWPLRLYPFITDEEGDICWQYYDTVKAGIPSQNETCFLVTFSLLAKEDAKPNFVDSYVMVFYNSDYGFPLEYSNPVYPDFDANDFLHRPTINSDYSYNDPEGYKYEFILPCTFTDPRESGYSGDARTSVEFRFYHLEEQKWYRTKLYRIILGEDLIDGESPIDGGKVTMECLE